MNPILLLAAFKINKKYLLLVLATLAIVVALPVMSVFALGSSALAFLANSFSGSDSTVAISTTTVGLYEGPEVAGDNYAWGNCTYWVYALRLKTGDPIPTTWGNAATWAPRALLDGYAVDDTPTVGSIMQTSTVDNGLGHVAYVTAVDPTTGAWTISEMNVEGLDIIDIKTLPAVDALQFSFIHDKEPLL
jgi:surface antigen